MESEVSQRKVYALCIHTLDRTSFFHGCQWSKKKKKKDFRGFVE